MAAAITYRDGLIIALLAARPLRLRNLTGLDLDHTLVRRGTQWWIEFSESETKTNNVIELPWPEALVAPLETYLARHRHVLANMRGGSTRPVGDALWVSGKGSAMTRNGIYWLYIKAHPRRLWPFDQSSSVPGLRRHQHCDRRSAACRHRSTPAWPSLGFHDRKILQSGREPRSKPARASVSALPAPQQADHGRARLVGKVLTRLTAAPASARGIPARRGCPSWSADTPSRRRMSMSLSTKLRA